MKIYLYIYREDAKMNDDTAERSLENRYYIINYYVSEEQYQRVIIKV